MLQAALQEKEGSMQALRTRLHESQSKLEALEQSANAAMQAAEQRHAAVEERARLSEQVLPPLVLAWACCIVITCTDQHPAVPQDCSDLQLCVFRISWITNAQGINALGNFLHCSHIKWRGVFVTCKISRHLIVEYTVA